MQIKEALTFDDILLVPNKSNILPNETDTQTRITSSILLIAQLCHQLWIL